MNDQEIDRYATRLSEQVSSCSSMDVGFGIRTNEVMPKRALA